MPRFLTRRPDTGGHGRNAPRATGADGYDDALRADDAETAATVDAAAESTGVSMDDSAADDDPDVDELIKERAGEFTDRDAASPWLDVDWLICAGLVVLALVVVGLHVRAYPILSPIDELQHIDYTLKASEFDVPRIGELVGAEAMAEAACRSVDAPQYVGPPCGLDEYDPATFQELGVNTAASQFPPYYTVTGLLARVTVWLGVVGSPVTAARLVGGLWLGAAMAVLWYLMSLFGISRAARAVPIIGLMATPLVVFHSATVNPDAALLLTGGIVVLASLKFEQGRLHPLWLVSIDAAMFVVESTNLLIIAFTALYLTARMWSRREIPWLTRATPIVILPVFVVLRASAASRIREALFPREPVARSGPRAPMFERNRVEGVSFDRVLQQLDATFTPLKNVYIPPPLRSQVTIAWIQATDWVFIAAMLAAATLVALPNRIVLLARLGVVAMLAAGPVYTFYYAFFSNADYAAPGRFGLPLLPVLAIVVAAVLENRRARVGAAVIVAGSALTTLVQLAT